MNVSDSCSGKSMVSAGRENLRIIWKIVARIENDREKKSGDTWWWSPNECLTTEAYVDLSISGLCSCDPHHLHSGIQLDGMSPSGTMAGVISQG